MQVALIPKIKGNLSVYKRKAKMDAKKKNILTAIVLVLIAVAIYIFSVMKAMS